MSRPPPIPTRTDRLVPYSTLLRSALWLLGRTTMALRGKGTNAVGAAAVDYLRLFSLVAYGWMWVRMAAAAAGDTPQHSAKRAVADYFVARMLPQAQALAASVAAGEETLMALPAAYFCAGPLEKFAGSGPRKRVGAR